MPDLECRVAKLEQAVEGLRDMIKEEKRETSECLRGINESLDDLKKNMEKQRGFVGGVIFTVSAVFSVVTWMFSNGHGNS